MIETTQPQPRQGERLKPVFATAVFAAVALQVVVAAAPASARALEDELIQLLAEHPQIQSQRAQVESARRAVEGARSGYLPEVEVSGSYGPTRIRVERTDTGPQDDFNESQQVARFSVTQNLFDGFETPAQVKIARYNVDVARLALEGTQQTVLFDGIAAYLEVLRQKRLVELAQLSEESIRQQAELEGLRVERGGGIAVDVLQARSRLQIALERRVAFEGALQNAVSRYINMFDHAPAVDALAEPEPPLRAIPEDLAEAIDIASNENPAIGSSLATVAVASERRRLARADYFPTIDLVGSANYEQDFDLLPGVRRDVSVVLQATWQLFDGFATRASVAQAAFDYQASRENQDFVVRGVVEATRLAWQQLVTARDRVTLLEDAVQLASEAFDARRALREAGKDTVINVLIAEDEVNNARINLTSARFDARLAAYELLLAMGRLDIETLDLRG